jgi:FMN phosphatase YigB (HAD superfamily)
MVDNGRPECTLEEVFSERFYPALRLNRTDVEATIRNFYNQEFTRLKELTRPRTEAVRMVEEAFGRGYRVVVATNPLFPRLAIEHRLDWAGLPVEKYPFDLVTSYESFHFAKPNPAFYAEVLARLGWPEGPVVMVGNSLEEDIWPARNLGLPAFWLTPPTGVMEANGLPSAAGVLQDILPWIDHTPAEQLQPDYGSPQALLGVLRSTPAILDYLVRGADSEDMNIRPEPDSWSLTEILCHLRDVEAEVNLPRIRKMLQEANPFIPGQDTDPWAEERAYIRQNGLQALHRFNADRWEVLRILEEAPLEDWDRTARHAIFGPTRLAELIAIQAGHDRLHVAQAHAAAVPARVT